MINSYIKASRKFFSLNINDKKILTRLFISSVLRNVCILIIPFVASTIIKYLSIGRIYRTFMYVIIFLVVTMIYVMFHHLKYDISTKSAIITRNKLQKKLLDKISSYDEKFTKNLTTAYVITTSFNDIGNLMHAPDAIFNIMTELLSIGIGFIILINVNIYIGFITMILTVISFCVFSYNIKKRDIFLSRQRGNQGNISNLMEEVTIGAKEIKAFNMSEDISKYLDKYTKTWKKDYYKKRDYIDNMFVLTPLILTFGKLFIYLIAIALILNKNYNVSFLLLVIGYYENIENEFRNLIKRIDAFSELEPRIDRIHKIINYQEKNSLKFGNYDEDNINGSVKFDKVCYEFDGKKIIDNVSFEIKPCSFTAIVGKSGSGKTTIFRLLLRLCKKNSGDILIDDVNIYDYNKDVYANNVSIVTQNPTYFDMSIRENLSLVDSNLDNQINVCKRVGIHDYIMSLKDGYNTKLSGDAMNLSAGQRQLLALARILLSKSEILLFDEVTSSLDLATSKEVVKLLKELKKDHTIILVTHKSDLMKEADNIIVLDSGRLVGNGKHRDLIKDNKYYIQLQK